MDKIGERIRQQRESLGFNQSELGKKVGLTSGAISMIEKGERKPSYEIIIKLSEVLGVTTDFLMGRSDENKIEISLRGGENLTDDERKQKAGKGDNSNGSK